MKYYREEKLDSSDLAFGDKYLKIEIKFCNNKITTSFHSKAPEKGIKWVCLSAIAIDCVFKSGKKCYWPTFLGECKHRIK